MYCFGRIVPIYLFTQQEKNFPMAILTEVESGHRANEQWLQRKEFLLHPQ